jgi:hypothetical protein
MSETFHCSLSNHADQPRIQNQGTHRILFKYLISIFLLILKGFTKEFPSLTSLIVHHSVMQELLPCPLLLHRPSSGLLADYLEHANNFVDIDSSVLLELTRKKGVE